MQLCGWMESRQMESQMKARAQHTSCAAHTRLNFGFNQWNLGSTVTQRSIERCCCFRVASTPQIPGPFFSLIIAIRYSARGETA